MQVEEQQRQIESFTDRWADELTEAELRETQRLMDTLDDMAGGRTGGESVDAALERAQFLLNAQRWVRSTEATSPGSTRKPRIFTCVSDRPRNSNVPSTARRTTSPVRYIRAPDTNGSGTNRVAVSPGRPRYPRVNWPPARYSSPAAPGGTGRSHESST